MKGKRGGGALSTKSWLGEKDIKKTTSVPGKGPSKTVLRLIHQLMGFMWAGQKGWGAWDEVAPKENGRKGWKKRSTLNDALGVFTTLRRKAQCFGGGPAVRGGLIGRGPPLSL